MAQEILPPRQLLAMPLPFQDLSILVALKWLLYWLLSKLLAVDMLVAKRK
jgi:hypothetical protein